MHSLRGSSQASPVTRGLEIGQSSGPRAAAGLSVRAFTVRSRAPLGEGTPSPCTGVAVSDAIWPGILHSGGSEA